MRLPWFARVGGEPWIFGFPNSGAADYVRREGLEVISDTVSAPNLCLAIHSGK